MAILMTCPDAMPGFNHDLDDVHTPASDFAGFSQATLIPSPAPGMFPFSQTVPADLSNGSPWESTVEGTQNFPDFQDHGAGDAYSPFTLGHVTPTRGEEMMDDFHNKWHMTSTEAAVTAPTSEPMRRMTSRSSTGSHKQRTSSKPRRRLQATLSQASQRSYEMIGNAPMDAGRTGMLDVNSYLDMDNMNVSAQSLYHGLPTSGFSPEALAYSAVGLSQHVNPACTQMQMDFDQGLAVNSPAHSWDSYSSGLGRTPSPGISEDAWMGQNLASSPTDTSGSSPLFQSQSPRMSRKYGSQQQFPAADESQVNAVPDEFSLPTSAFGLTRTGSEGGESARDHPLYKNAAPQPDGLFHCPFEGTDSCNHKPEKLKCNYDKFVDSHLKPYRCKLGSCENARFSSTACLLRHEREAHGMHGHGDKPYLCTYPGCDRSQPGNGFPRHWNLKDHMKRVHNDVAPSQQTGAGASPPPSGPTSGSGSGSQAQAKTRKRKKDTASEPASSGSSRKSSLKSSLAQAQAPAPAQTAPPAIKVEDRAAKSVQKWHDHHQKLTGIVSGFTQPDDPNMIQYLRDAQDQLAAISKISQTMISKKSHHVKGDYSRAFLEQTG